MSIVPLALRIYPSSPHSTMALSIIVYVDNNALRYYCDNIVDSIETSIAEDASNTDLWYLVCCTTLSHEDWPNRQYLSNVYVSSKGTE